jgi:hypothetical protein
MTSRVRDNRQSAKSETYGRHSRAHASVSVASLLQQAMAEGEAIRLAWLGDGVDETADDDEWPTAVLPGFSR